MSEVKLLQLPGFASKGINSDLPTHTLDGDYLTEALNIRIINKKITPFGGTTVWDVLPAGDNPGFLMHVGSTSGDFWIIPCDDKVLVYDGGVFSDISNVAAAGYPGIGDPDDWHGCELAVIPIINHPNHHPEYWPDANGAVPLEYLPWDATRTWEDAGEQAQIIRSHKQFLFAMNLQSNSEQYIDGVRWSSPADIGGVPETWDHLDTTNVAGLVNLGGQGGRIIDGLTLRDAFAVYRETSISIFDYVGGQFVWRIRHLSTHQGLVSKDAIAEVKGWHYFIGDGDILKTDGNQIISMLHNRLRVRFSSNYDADQRQRSYVLQNNIASEIWFCIPEIGHEYPNIAYIYNHEDDSWAIRNIPEVPFANYGPQANALETWDGTPGNWDASLGNWNQGQTSALVWTLVGVSKPGSIISPGASGELIFFDAATFGSVTPFSTNIERIGFALEGLDDVTTITRLYPHIRGPGTVLIQVGSQDHPGAPVRWKPAVPFVGERDRKVDIRTTGELHSFRFYTQNDVAQFDLSGMDIEYVMAGKR